MSEPVLGRADAAPSEQIDTFPLEGPVDRVTFTTSELIAECPVTGGPDFYDLEVSYSPADRCIESKSLKLYLQTFAGHGIFAEHLAPAIGRHLAAAVGVPVTVELRQQVRGGITTVVAVTVTPQ
jgi:7-cyano-7-deazaguanine reductase